MDTIDYTIHRLDAGRIADLEDLHKAVYGRRPAREHYQKKYQTAYTGQEYIGYIAYDAEEVPVGYYGVIPCFIRQGDKKILAAQSADTMTHPGYRFKGMFVELSRITFQLCRDNGIDLIFGFPNDNSYHGAVTKLGWRIVGHMTRFTIPVRSIPLRSLSAKFPRLAPIYNGYCNWVLPPREQSGIGNGLLSEGFAGIDRDSAYLQYKTFSPTNVIKVNGVQTWIRVRDGLLLGDLQTPGATMTEIDCKKAINGLKKIARQLGLSSITFIVSEDTLACRLFAGLYEPMPSYPLLIQDFGAAIDPKQLRFSFADIDIF